MLGFHYLHLTAFIWYLLVLDNHLSAKTINNCPEHWTVGYSKSGLNKITFLSFIRSSLRWELSTRYDIFSQQMPLNWDAASMMHTLTSPVISWSNLLPTQLLLSQSRSACSSMLPEHSGLYSVLPACTCSEDHLLVLTLWIILPGQTTFWPRTDWF